MSSFSDRIRNADYKKAFRIWLITAIVVVVCCAGATAAAFHKQIAEYQNIENSGRNSAAGQTGKGDGGQTLPDGNGRTVPGKGGQALPENNARGQGNDSRNSQNNNGQDSRNGAPNQENSSQNSNRAQGSASQTAPGNTMKSGTGKTLAVDMERDYGAERGMERGNEIGRGNSAGPARDGNRFEEHSGNPVSRIKALIRSGQISEPSAAAKAVAVVSAVLLALTGIALWVIIIFWLRSASELAAMNRTLWTALGIFFGVIAAVVFLILRSFMRKRCVRCGTWQNEAEYCRKCGAPMKTVCPSCGNECALDDRFCTKCGSDLTANAAEAGTKPGNEAGPEAPAEK